MICLGKSDCTPGGTWGDNHSTCQCGCNTGSLHRTHEVFSYLKATNLNVTVDNFSCDPLTSKP